MNKLADISAFESLSISHTTAPVTAFNQRKAVNNKMGRFGKTLGALTLGAATLLPGCGWIHKPGEFLHNHFTSLGREETDHIKNIEKCETYEQLNGFTKFVTNPATNRDMPRVLPAYVDQFEKITRDILKKNQEEARLAAAAARKKQIEAARQLLPPAAGEQNGESTSGKVANRRITNRRTPRQRVFNGFFRKTLPWVLAAAGAVGGGEHARNHPEDAVRVGTFLNTPISEHLDEAKWQLQKINPFDNRSVGRLVVDKNEANIRAINRAVRREALINLYLADCLSKVQTDPSDQRSKDRLANLLNYARRKKTSLKPEITNTLKKMNVKWP